MERISAQMQFTTPVIWDDMVADTLREAVVDIHNIVFGQLGTLAFTMQEIGLSFEEVQGTILELSRGAQLVEDQEHDLMKSIRKTYNMLHVEGDPSTTALSFEQSNMSQSSAPSEDIATESLVDTASNHQGSDALDFPQETIEAPNKTEEIFIEYQPDVETITDVVETNSSDSVVESANVDRSTADPLNDGVEEDLDEVQL